MSSLNNYYPQYHNSGHNQFTPMYTHDGLLQTLLHAMKGEASAVDFYSRLAELAPNPNDKNDILRIVEDEKEHLQSFVNLFYALTNRHPQYQVERIAFNTFEEGLKVAYEDELKDYETYRNQYLKTKNQAIRDVFFRAFSDEIKHASRFSDLKSKGKENLRNTDIPPLTVDIKDYGPEPFVVDITEVTKRNETFRTALWTGEHLQLTLMSIDVGEEIGVEMHPDTDQFLRIEEGEGIVRMGRNETQYDFEEDVYDNYVVLIPAGKWHNIINTGDKPLKVFSIYAPPHHPQGTVHRTKANAMHAKEHDEK